MNRVKHLGLKRIRREASSEVSYALIGTRPDLAIDTVIQNHESILGPQVLGNGLKLKHRKVLSHQF